MYLEAERVLLSIPPTPSIAANVSTTAIAEVNNSTDAAIPSAAASPLSPLCLLYSDLLPRTS